MDDILKLLQNEIKGMYDILIKSDKIMYHTACLTVFQIIKQIINLPVKQQNIFIDECISFSNKQLEIEKAKGVNNAKTD